MLKSIAQQPEPEEEEEEEEEYPEDDEDEYFDEEERAQHKSIFQPRRPPSCPHLKVGKTSLTGRYFILFRSSIMSEPHTKSDIDSPSGFSGKIASCKPVGSKFLGKRASDSMPNDQLVLNSSD